MKKILNNRYEEIIKLIYKKRVEDNKMNIYRKEKEDNEKRNIKEKIDLKVNEV